MSLLNISQLHVRFDGQPAAAVADLSLHIAQGEVLALAGESGSGKSVTAAAILGLLPPKATVSGEIRFDGESLLHQSDRALNRLRGHDIAMVFQNSLSTLDPSWQIGRQLQQNLRRLHPQLNGRSLRKEALAWLEKMHIRQPEQVMRFYPHQLSGGMRQRILIALAAMCRPRLLIADEPTTALDPSVQREVLQLLKTLCQQENMAMLLITHDFGVVAELSDRVAVMQQGSIVETGATTEVIAQPQHPYTRALLAAIPRPDLSEVQAHPQAATLLEGRQLSRSFWHRGSEGWWPKKHPVTAVDRVSLTICEGEIVGIIGESGSGKSTLARLLAQLERPDGGEVLFAGQRADGDAQSLKAFRQQLQCVFQDSLSSFNPRLRLQEQLIRPQLRLGSASGRAEAAERARQMFAEVGLSDALLQRFPHELSGGQRQRANIARALVVDPRFLILDEPTSALDLSVQDQVLRLLERLHQRHAISCLLISHNLAVVAQFCHRILVMDGGSIVDDFPRHRLYDEQRHPVTRRLLAANYLTPGETDRSEKLTEKRRA